MIVFVFFFQQGDCHSPSGWWVQILGVRLNLFSSRLAQCKIQVQWQTELTELVDTNRICYWKPILFDHSLKKLGVSVTLEGLCKIVCVAECCLILNVLALAVNTRLSASHELMSSRKGGSKILKRVFYMCSLSCQRAFGLSWVNVEAGNVRHGQKKKWDYEAAGCCHGVVMRHKSWFDGSGCLDQEGHGLRTAETLSSATEQERGLFWSLDDVDLIFWFIIPTLPTFALFPSYFMPAISLSLSFCLISWWTDIWQAYGCLWWEGAAQLRWILGQRREKKVLAHHS